MMTWDAPSMVVSSSGLAYSLLYCLQCLVVTLGLSDTDMCDTLVLHNGLNICKVEVDQMPAG